MNVIELVKMHEGFSSKPYKCPAGKLTIGYGRNLDANGITKEEADFMLSEDIENIYLEMTKILHCFADLDDVRQAVFVDMGYNMGLRGFLKFKNMLKAVEAHDYTEAAKEMLDSEWAKQVKKRAVRLAKMMETGEWPS